MPQSHTQPRSVVFWDSSLKTSTRRVYGYQPYCSCGWEGKVWKTHHESQLERSFHRCEDRRKEVAELQAELATGGTEAS